MLIRFCFVSLPQELHDVWREYSQIPAGREAIAARGKLKCQ